MRIQAFDYANVDAIGMLTQEDLNGKNFKADVVINDKDISNKPGSNISQLKLITENGNTGLIINGPDEKPRTSIRADSLGNPLIQAIDTNGKIRRAVLKPFDQQGLTQGCLAILWLLTQGNHYL